MNKKILYMLMCSSALGIASCGGGGDNNTSSNKDSSNSTQCSSSQYLENSQCKDKIAQNITYFNLPESIVIGSSYPLYAKLSSELTATFTSQTIDVCTIINQEKVQTIAEGTCIVQASQPGNSKFLSAPSIQKTITINPESLLTRTGVTLCANQDYNEIPCHLIETLGAFFGLGQDGETKIGKELSYTLLNNNGSECIKDNVTGLIWEKKTDDGTLRDKKWLYTWYDPEISSNNGEPVVKDTAEFYRDYDNKSIRMGNSPSYTNDQKTDGYSCGKTISKCNAQDYINELNKIKYCGYSDWRTPTPQEFYSIMDYSGKQSENPRYGISGDYWTNMKYVYSEINTGVVDHIPPSTAPVHAVR
ncbi:DUF1566 domain-containing protein [Acinetobacter sp. VNH17]|uniref:DUF1566 domain-containing protein n=1 Tax=Acinetobacter thutiue TaxID=2998078 RepID=A0ABT7WQR3_9GAMM|nr:DUF1566 domain-containing protein [Acinetobacter thutiue]MCY6412894.1 DUF1566 domain-containing protein [Acinetobacter thutiue]MDN0015001.1 DUF1566 domain-containing protein [Acinetobacter thutiue]